MPEDEKIVAMRIEGHVQGVGFRAFVQREAERLGITGWVRNRANGVVQALFAGSASAVAAIIEACRRGPAHARVNALDVAEADRTALKTLPASGFHLLPTL